MSVSLTHVSKSFGPTRAVEDVSLELRPGELVGVLGPSGCGKTTLLRLIAGFERPDAGEVVVGGRPVAAGRTFVAPEKRRIGMVFQDYALFPHLTVERNVAFGLRRRGDERAQRTLELVGLQHKAGRYPHELSGGERQRVALARALAPEPDVVLLDEPFSSLDATLRGDLRREVELILREAGATTLLVTHDQEEALSLVDRLAVMRDGRIVQVGAPQEVYAQPASRWAAQFVGEVNVLSGPATPWRPSSAASTCRAATARRPAASTSRSGPSSSSCAATRTATPRSSRASSAATTSSTGFATRPAGRCSCSSPPSSSSTSATGSSSPPAARRSRRSSTRPQRRPGPSRTRRRSR
jgi:iron(III) transport system ATP-binding protein